MTDTPEPAPTTAQKALTVNLDDSIYGAIVEIGAGQEVARQFFAAGAAAGTVAKTMSAYDMQISDNIYGKAGRYVSKERLVQMLEKEYSLLLSRLGEARPPQTRFFAYAATVAARSFKGDNPCFGYVGIRFQLQPKAPPCDIMMHVQMMDQDAASQAEALGILGVNTVYGAFYQSQNPTQFIEHLLDNLHSDRLEIDKIEFRGPAFTAVDDRLMNLHLIRSWCTRAVMFNAQGQPRVPSGMLRKRPILVLRGSFKPPTLVHLDMFESSLREFNKLEHIDRNDVLCVAELTMAELGSGPNYSDHDFLARVDLLNSLGYSVLISDYLRFFRLRSWLRQYTHMPIGISLSVLDFDHLFDDKYYVGVEGGILEAMGKLFSDDTHMFVYPTVIDGQRISLANLKIDPKHRLLLQYLLANNMMLDSPAINEANLHISAREIAKLIPAGRGEWEQMLPANVSQAIIERGLFGYPADKS